MLTSRPNEQLDLFLVSFKYFLENPMLSSRRALAVMAALALSAGSAPLVLAQQPALVSAAPRPVRAGKRSLFGGIRASVGLYGRKGAGVSVAQGKRNARKTRNIARNRLNHR